jgi:hypothetical protein
MERSAMRDLLMLFGVTLAKRCTKRQKRIFYSQVVPFFEKLGYSVDFQKSDGKLNQTANLIIGNLAKSKTVVMCPYDTPTASLLPYKYYPFNWKNNLNQEYLNLGLNFIIYVLFGGLLFYFLNYFSHQNSFLSISGTILLVLLVFLSYSIIGGVPNSVNFNKNSASLALLASIAQKIKNDPGISFVLLDNNASSSTGLKLLSKNEQIKNKFLIYLDCIAHGEKIAFIHNQESNSETPELEKHFKDLNIIDKMITEERGKETNLQFFPRMVHICAGTIINQNFVVLDTRSKKDFKVDIPQLEKIQEGLLTYLRG